MNCRSEPSQVYTIRLSVSFKVMIKLYTKRYKEKMSYNNNIFFNGVVKSMCVLYY